MAYPILYPHDGYGRPYVAVCNGNGCVHSSSCPVSLLPHFAQTPSSIDHNVVDPNALKGPPNIAPCLFYQQNRCSQGDKCRFSHTVLELGSNVSSSSSVPCKFFRQGTCRNGQDCPFLHEVPDTSSSGEFENSETPVHPQEVDIIDPPNDTEPPPDSFTPTRAISTEAASLEPCTFHATGQCERGNSCTVHHDANAEPIYSPIPSSSSPLVGDSGDWVPFSEDAIARAAASRTAPVCGACGYDSCKGGEDCRFQPQPSVPFGPQIWKPCRYFQSGFCTKRDACPYVHDARMQKLSSTSTNDDSHDYRPRYGRGNGSRFHRDSNEQTMNRLADADESSAWDGQGEMAQEEMPRKWSDDFPVQEDGGIESSGFQDSSGWGNDEQSESKWNSTSANAKDGEGGDSGWADLAWGGVKQPRDSSDNPWNTGSGWIQETDQNPAWGHGTGANSTDAVSNDQPMDDAAAEQTWTRKPRRNPLACKYYSQGACYHGTGCRFLHIQEETRGSDHDDGGLIAQADNFPQAEETSSNPSPLDLPTIAEDLPPRSIFRCTVSFSSGALPEQVITPFESLITVLSNYPPGMAHADLLKLAEPYGVVEDTSFKLTNSGLRAHIQFKDHVQAAEARLNLDGLNTDDCVMRADLDCVGAVSGSLHQLPGNTRQLKLVWDAPSVSAWAFYKNVRVAKDEAVRLNESIFCGRKITAEYRKPSQANAIPVHLSSLPADTKREELLAFCVGATSVSLNSPNYLEAQDANILDYLRKNAGPVNFFKVLPAEPSELKITGFVEFESSDAATAALPALKGIPHDFLGKGTISAQAVYYSKYDCPNHCPFPILLQQLPNLRDLSSDFCVIRWHNQPPSVHIYGREAKPMVAVVRTVQTLVFGFVLSCWDPYFDTPSSEEALRRINSDSSFYVHPDKLQRVLRVWGDSDKAEKQITRLLKRVQAQRHTLRLNEGLLSALLNGGLSSLHDDFGASKILLDLRSESLTILGDMKEAVEGRLNALVPVDSRGRGCCLCHSNASDLVELACNHVYCSPCLKLLVRPTPGVGFSTLRCIARVGSTETCLATLPIPVILSQLSAEEQTQLLEAAFLAFIHSKNDFQFCFSGCPVVYQKGQPGTVFTCPDCRLDLCASCMVPKHVGLTCAEYAEAMED